MNKNTTQQFTQYTKAIARQYGVDNVAQQFNVEPAQAQRIVGKIQESDAFLKQINVLMVAQLTGEVIMVGVNGLTAARTNTKISDRRPKAHYGLGKNEYLCRFTEFDTAVTYAQLDAWSHHPAFKTLISKQTTTANALSLIMIGWNGVEYKAATDPIANPLGQDVNAGWLAHLKERKPENYADANEIIIGDGDKESNLDILVLQAKNALSEVHRQNPNLVAIIGSDVLTNAKERLYDKNGETPSEKSKVELKQVVGTFGGLATYEVPYFPARGILVTTFKNLSIYIHSSMRRQVKDNSARSQIETFSSKSVDYVVEEYDLMSYIDSKKVKFSGE